MVSRWLLTLLAAASTCHGFQFMKNWKMPTHDPHQEAVQERFGDKSEYRERRARAL
jgi:hypothetical protein